MNETAIPTMPEPQPVNELQNYWQWAHQVAFHSSNAEKSLHMLVAQWQSICPNANEDELQTAVINLRGILRLD